MQQAADEIGLSHRGRRVQLVNLDQDTGKAWIVYHGCHIEVPVESLTWNA